MEDIAKGIQTQFKDMGIEVPLEEIEERLDKLVNKFKVPANEARKNTVNVLLKQYNVNKNEFFNQSKPATMSNIADVKADQWVNVDIKVLQLWDNSNSSISQVGLVGDSTGRIKFIKWARDNLPDVEEGKSYRFSNVVVNEWNGKLELTLNRTSSIEPLATDIDAGSTSAGASEECQVSDLNQENMWANIEAKVVQLWDNSNEAISQVGILGDESGTIKFIKWSRDDLPDVEEGKSYLFSNVVVNEWNGKYEVTLNRTSNIEPLEEDIDTSFQPQGSAEDRLLSELRQENMWANIEAKVVQLWDNSNDAISQVGILGDKTGTIKFVKWSRDDLPDVEEGNVYRFNNIVVNEWNGNYEVILNRTTTIEPLSEEIEVGANSFQGAMIDIQDGSGLIKRCPECNRALTKGACMEHGKVDGNYDLRIKAVLDNGDTVQDVLLNREITEELTGITLEEAINLAADALDQTVVVSKMREDLVGKYYCVEGSLADRYLIAKSIEPLSTVDMEKVDELIADLEVA
ncbi:replication protein A [Methanohalophilus euhalobius]|uniref:Replication factor A1 n=1 Tax=Methanohalophilus euhalobius TaxID=51203 RepID=A0A314ZVT7_9EURY|nr:replication protein A [Methanohalophilus euhalobius]PQV42061.1 replication factor A1 [Methanohalophilus euhalobius]RNI12185.1 replication protein A [Methanohalophilus euhalobius]